MKNTLDIQKLKFDQDGLIPVVVQDYESGEVIMLAKMDEGAVAKTFATGYTHFYNPAKKAVYKFGGTLGNTQRVKVAFLDNDADTLLLKVTQKGKADAEKDNYTCFSEQLVGEYNDIGGEMFGRLQRILEECRKNPETGSYTSFLFVRGIDRMGKKVGEEAVELVIASKNEEKAGVINEAADLLYHVMVLLNERGVSLSEVCAELCKRNR
jgi:phosphoribosyl-ATP pyrophosphohydrolase/phosphoribosyl-AMP cyclohydrolase